MDGSLLCTNPNPKLSGVCLFPVVHFQPVLPTSGVCPTFPTLFLSPGGREDTFLCLILFGFWILLCALSAFRALLSALCQALGRDLGIGAVTFVTAEGFFFFFAVMASFYFPQYIVILNGNFPCYNLGMAGLCLDAMELDANILLEEQ